MKSGIYKIELNNGYYYYGQAQDFKKRKSIHFARLKQGKHENSKLQNIFNKYGGNSFIIIEFCELEKLSEREQFYIDKYFNDLKCCNLSPSSNTVRGLKRSEESKIKNRVAKLGSKLTVEHRKNISKGLFIAYNTTRIKPNLNGINNPFYNKKHSKESKDKMKVYRKDKLKGENNYNAKLLLNIETGIFYGSCIEASFVSEIKESNLRGMVNGNKKNKTNFIRV